MRCPTCDSATLKLIKIENDFFARKCFACQGILIDLHSYGKWKGYQQTTSYSSHDTIRCIDDSTINCPICSKAMPYYQTLTNPSNRIHSCHHCNKVWINDGKWKVLSDLAFHSTKLNIADLLT